jgi:hypothetical protein
MLPFRPGLSLDAHPGSAKMPDQRIARAAPAKSSAASKPTRCPTNG